MAFLIVTYDVDVLRVNRVRKILLKYLSWSQNSVFEGELTEGLLSKCKAELKKSTDSSYDSIYFYKVDNPKNMRKETMGREKNPNDVFL